MEKASSPGLTSRVLFFGLAELTFVRNTQEVIPACGALLAQPRRAVSSATLMEQAVNLENSVSHE
jgi:hypothetical protein